MLKNKRLLVSLICVVFLIASVISGCGSKDNTDGQKTTTAEASAATQAASTTAAKADTGVDTSKEVELVYYFVNTPQNDVQTVNDEINKLVKAKINATVKMNIVDWGSYDQKMNLIMASGDAYDLCFTSTWTNNFYQNVAKGAYIPLDELLKKYAPTTLKNAPATFWDVAKVGGKIYGAINFQQATAGFGIKVQKQLADKYAFDWKSLKSLSDCTPFLEAIKKNEPTLIPFGYDKNLDPFVRGTIMHGMEALGDIFSPGWINVNDSNMKVINQFDTPEFKAHVKLMREWFTKGYIRKDAATLKDTVADQKAAKNALQFEQIDIDTADFDGVGMKYAGRMNRDSDGKIESFDKRFVNPVLTTEKAAATLTAISKTSANPERAMMFIELLNSDKQIYNTMIWGIEGTHYVKTSEPNMITPKDKAGYNTFAPWEFGFMGNSLLPTTGWPSGSGEEIKGVPKAHKMWIDVNTNAKPSPALGFVFNYEPVKSEIANCKAVTDQLYFAIASGSVDPDKFIPELNQKLKTAGMDKIIAEKQKQLDAWKVGK